MRAVVLVCLAGLLFPLLAFGQGGIVSGSGYLYAPTGEVENVQPKAPEYLVLPVERLADEGLRGPVRRVSEQSGTGERRSLDWVKEYDARGRVTRIEIYFSGSRQYLKTVSYCGDGGRTETVTTLRGRDIFHLDPAGRLLSELAYHRDERGRFIFLKDEVHHYDGAGHELDWQTWTPAKAPPKVEIAERRQRYDAAGHFLTAETRARGGKDRWQYTYNVQGKVVSAIASENGAFHQGQTFAYDAQGRLVREELSDQSGLRTVVTYRFNAAGRVASSEMYNWDMHIITPTGLPLLYGSVPVDKRKGAPPLRLHIVHTYDAAGRLLKSAYFDERNQPCYEWLPSNKRFPIGFPPACAYISYTYDCGTPKWTAYNLNNQPVRHPLYPEQKSQLQSRRQYDARGNWTRSEVNGQVQMREVTYY